MNVLDAASNVAEDYPGGGTALAHRIDRNPTTLLQDLRGTGGAKLGLATAVKMTQRSGDLRILHAFAAECGQMCLPLPEALQLEGDDCMDAVAHASREFAELCAEALKARGDRRTSGTELARIQREGGEVIARIHGLISAFAADHEAGKPAALRAAA